MIYIYIYIYIYTYIMIRVKGGTVLFGFRRALVRLAS